MGKLLSGPLKRNDLNKADSYMFQWLVSVARSERKEVESFQRKSKGMFGSRLDLFVK